MSTQGRCGSVKLGPFRCVSWLAIAAALAACSPTRATVPASATAAPTIDTKSPPAAATSTAPSKRRALNAAQAVAKELFGQTIGPIIEVGEEGKLAPENYRTEWLGNGDFDANGLSDAVFLLRRDPQALSPRPPECVLILTLAIDDSHYEIYGVNPYEVGCEPAHVDGATNEVNESSITVKSGGYNFDTSYGVSYDPNERRFVVSHESHLQLDPELQTGSLQVLEPLAGRGSVDDVPPSAEGPQPIEFPIRRVYFEDLGASAGSAEPEATH